MHTIYTYYDYHKFLNDFYVEKKSKDSYYTLRYIGERIGIDHALVVKIFQGKRHLSGQSIQVVADFLGLSKRQAEYFELLVMYGKAKTDREIKGYFEKLLSFSDIAEHKIEADSYEFYQKWYYSAIREIIHLAPFNDDYKWLARMVEPSVTVAEAKKSVRLLERLGFIKRNDRGFFELTSKFITTGEHWKSIAIRSFQKEISRLSENALDTIPKEERDISTVTLTLDEEGFDKAREHIRLLQKELIEISSSCRRVNRAYQVNLQLFPLSKKVAGSGNGSL